MKMFTHILICLICTWFEKYKQLPQAGENFLKVCISFLLSFELLVIPRRLSPFDLFVSVHLLSNSFVRYYGRSKRA